MTRSVSYYLAMLLLGFVSHPTLAETPGKILAHYDVIGFGMTLANITETFTRNDDSYQIESVTKAVGLLAKLKPETIRILSQGKVTPQGLVPAYYSQTREIDKDKNASAKFNWLNSVLTLTDYKGVNEMPLTQGAQDRLSAMYHLPTLVKSGQDEFKFGITDGNDMKIYDFSVAPENKNISVPLGKFNARYIYSTPIGDEVKYEVWMATDRDDFPCKLTVTDSKGGKITQVLTELTITP
jgi:hypothetical protein